MQGVVGLEFGKRGATDIGQFVFFALSSYGFDEQKGQHYNDDGNHQHVKQVFDKRVLLKEVFIHNCL